MQSRKLFAEQLAKTIKLHHNKEETSFIFGLSGKWGEGKTTFLEILEEELQEEGNFKVVKIEAWKFAAERYSFLRNFLRLIGAKVPKYKFWHRYQLQKMYYDVSRTVIQWKILLYLLSGLLVAWGVYIYCIPESWQSVMDEWRQQNKTLFNAVAAVLIIPLLPRLISIQRSNRSIETLDGFDGLLENILKKLSKNKVVVFVDDLDRVTPRIARIVLDNLRTFFDRKELTFIVAGDHTVLERYMGEDILPKGKDTEQLEEGRRYLKKIFNIYWRLPLPIESEFEIFLNDLQDGKKQQLETIFPEDDLQILVSYLKKYFDKNFRHIERFIEHVIFTFQIIKIQHESVGDEKTKDYFQDLFDHPLLVVRALMIQELAAPFFETDLTPIN